MALKKYELFNLKNSIMTINIFDIIQQGERVTLECKQAKRSVPNSLWDTYSAFANTYGGTILLGVVEHLEEQDKSKRFEIVGVEDADKIRRDLWNTINSKEKVNINLLHDEDVQTIEVDGKSVIAINVPRAEYSTRPVYINNNLSRGSFKRNHEGDYHCTEQELRMMLRDANEAGNDRMVLEYYTMEDVDIPTLESYRIMFKTDNPDHVWNSLGHKDFLMQLGGYGVDRKEGIEGLTMAGLLMFGKGLPIRDKFDNLRMDYIDKSHLVGQQRYSDRLTYDGRWENNLYNFVRLVLPKLTIDLPRPFQMEGIVRKDDTMLHKALREAVTNMIIHSDFLLNGILKIEKFDNRIVLTNPGLLKLPVEQIYLGGESKARNQRIQSMLRMIGYGENLGSGFPLIMNVWNNKHWIKPELIEQPELLQVKLTLVFEQDRMSATKHSGVKDGAKDGVKQTSDIQEVILNEIIDNPSITTKELAQKTGVKFRTLQRYVSQLQKLGLLEREGSRKDGHWVVAYKEKS
ncbi:MAG: RNA-binding domain-containing protein [Candidatus Limisoma sp.]